jgi:pilus assembly protein FimV
VQEKLSAHPAGVLLAVAALSAAPEAAAISLGEVEVQSALGEALDARIPLGIPAGEVVDATCFALARDPEPGVPVISEGLLTVERNGDAASLRIRSSGAVYEPAVRLRVRASCPGNMGQSLRQYSILLDPRRAEPPRAIVAPVLPAAAAPATAAAPAASTPSSPRISAMLDARSGDTLGGIAAKVFPRNRAARERYLVAMREANPALASLGSSDPIPAGASVALPDLRGFARSTPASTQQAAAQPAPSRERVTRKKNARASARERAAPIASRAAPASGASGADFVLKLSGGQMDLAPTRSVDDRAREQLRERLLVLDSDDQVAAVLALRNRLTQLEARVNELQLKLAQMPATFPARAEPAPAQAAKVEAPAVTPAPAPATTASMPAPATAPATAQSESSAIGASKPEAESATKEAAPKAADAPAPAATEPARTPRAAPQFTFSTLWHTYGLWAAFIAVLALLMIVVWRAVHRRDTSFDDAAWEEAPDGPAAAAEMVVEPEMDREAPVIPPNARELRQRYLEERFPEVLNRTLDLDDPRSVVKSARLFYEDGAMPRAVELLQFAIEDDPAELRPWLALFEIFRLERLTGEYAELARRFYEHHGASDAWRKVRYFGREIDPGNFLYREDVDALETITPTSTPRHPPGERFDPVQENWLDAPMGFDNQVLANELRQALMGAAGVVDQDLVPNPMPALRDAEMFTVA